MSKKDYLNEQTHSLWETEMWNFQACNISKWQLIASVFFLRGLAEKRNQSHAHWRSSRERQPPLKQQRVSLRHSHDDQDTHQKRKLESSEERHIRHKKIKSVCTSHGCFFFTNSRASMGMMEENFQYIFDIFNIQRKGKKRQRERWRGKSKPIGKRAFLYKPNIKWPDVQGDPINFHSTSKNIIIPKQVLIQTRNLQRRNSSNPFTQTLNLPRIVCL